MKEITEEGHRERGRVGHTKAKDTQEHLHKDTHAKTIIDE